MTQCSLAPGSAKEISRRCSRWISPVMSFRSPVKILGVTLYSHLTFDKHVVDICIACSFHMHALRHIRPCLTDDVAKTIASVRVGSRLDYANAVLVGVSDKNITKLQLTQNILARIVTWKEEGSRYL